MVMQQSIFPLIFVGTVRAAPLVPTFFLFFFIPAIDFFKICAILYCMKDKTYNTYQARNAVKAAQVTNHIKAQKKVGVPHEEAKAEAYRLYNIKAARPILVRYWVAK